MAPGSSRAWSRSVSASLRSRSSSASREVRPQRDVRHQRERLVEPGDRDPQAHRRDVPRRAGADRRAQEVDRVGQRERVLAAGALVEHVGGHRREALAARGIGDGARAQHEDHLDHRHLVHADEHHADAVRQLEPLDGRQLERLRGGRASAGGCGRPCASAAAPAASRAAASERRGRARPAGRSLRHLRHGQLLLAFGHHRDQHAARAEEAAAPPPARRSARARGSAPGPPRSSRGRRCEK